jgi:hypothetical protein
VSKLYDNVPAPGIKKQNEPCPRSNKLTLGAVGNDQSVFRRKPTEFHSPNIMLRINRNEKGYIIPLNFRESLFFLPELQNRAKHLS